MKVLIVNGSPHIDGTTNTALKVVIDVLKNEGVDTELISLAQKDVKDCLGCNYCSKNNKCVFNDLVNEVGERALNCDGFIFASPVYYAHPSARLLAFMDRLFYSHGNALAFKPASGLVVARRAGVESSLEAINKHFSINQMPIISSTYWCGGFGVSKNEISLDLEGINTFTNLAKNMAWILKVIELGKKEGINHPNNNIVRMNFIR